MITIKARIKNQQDQSYPILIEDGLLQKIPDLLKKGAYGEKYAIITDTNVGKLYGQTLNAKMAAKGIQSEIITFPSGDQSKRLEIVEKIANRMLRKKFDRYDAVITLGGGVAGDLGGFVASIYMRGISYIHIPTSVVAMCDSSIGGKTGVNLEGGKNLIGRIEQPEAVFIDPSLLKTLPESDFITGMAEVLKYGAIMDSGLFKLLEKSYPQIQKRNRNILNKIIERSVKNKVSVIQKDVNEKGLRKILNYGHTLGHALEKMSNYKISHGEAIALGMKVVNIMAVQQSQLSQGDNDRINNLIDRYQIIHPKNIATIHHRNSHKLWNLMNSDKKAKSGSIQFVIPTSIGKHLIATSFTQKDFTQALKNYA
ncbi:3-dehydroquinate synthase [Candidatus Peregrinibacteria bacterium]|nr:3-dehydroquinate synthase [Candidatus Peregrinibacteria bacterium]